MSVTPMADEAQILIDRSARLWSAKTRLSAGNYEGVFMMQPAKDGIGTDGVRFFAAIARMGTWMDEGADRRTCIDD